MADDGDRVAAGGLILVGAERPSERRRDVHRGEEVAARQHAELDSRRARTVLGEPGRHRIERSEALEAPALVADVDVVRIRRRDIARAERFDRVLHADRVHLARVGNRQRPQHQRIGEAEDGAVGADADGERDHRDNGEARAGAQHADAVPEVLPEALEKDSHVPSIDVGV